jgi:uncharacterized protein YdcH (DUF465 family)
VRIKNGSLKIFEDTIIGLKVKEAEEGKLKIYKRREKELEPITVEQGVTVNRLLDVPVSEAEIDKLKAEMCNLKDRIDKSVTVNRPLDVPILEVEIGKLKEEMCNLKDRIDKMEELRESRSYESSRRVIEEEKIPSLEG